MRRISALVLAVASLLAVGAAPAWAASPVHEPLVLTPLDLPAGTICSFAIRLELTGGNLRQTTFAPAPDGSVRIIQRGRGTNTVTNVDSGESITLSGGSLVTLTFHADGSVTASGSGQFVAFYVAGDPAELGPGMHHVSGRVVEHYGTDGTLANATFRGRSVNICEVLAAD